MGETSSTDVESGRVGGKHQSLGSRRRNSYGELSSPLLGKGGESVSKLSWRNCLCNQKNLAVIAGPTLAICSISLSRILNVHLPPELAAQNIKIWSMLGAAIWICFWWLTGAVPVAITALIPLFLFPLLDIRDCDTVAKVYMNDTIALFLGSFIMALAVEHHNVHKRLALKILLLFGGKNMDPHFLLLGFCVGPAFVSMWISNTAAAVMMVPMALGVARKVKQGASHNNHTSTETDFKEGEQQQQQQNQESDFIVPGETPEPLLLYCRGLMLAIAYAVAIGGLSTLTGTGPNLILGGMWKSMFPEAAPITYLQWFLFAFPLGLIYLLILWLLLIWWYCPEPTATLVSASLHRSVIEQEYNNLGPISFAEKTVLSSFTVLALLWITRSVGDYGWGNYFNGLAGDGTVSIMVAIVLFMIPDCKSQGDKLMNWKLCKNLPWDIVLLLGGGFALADGIQASGLADWVTARLQFLDSLPYLVIAPVVAVLVTFLTQFTSNNSAATIFLPLLAQVAISMHANPLLFMIPATLGASFAFTLPISTPPNAIAFSTGLVPMKDMARFGLVLIPVGLLLIAVGIPTLGSKVFGLSSSPFISVPQWSTAFSVHQFMD